MTKRQQTRTRLTSDADKAHLKFPVTSYDQYYRYSDSMKRPVLTEKLKKGKYTTADDLRQRLEEICRREQKHSKVESLFNNKNFDESYPSSLTASVNSRETLIEEEIADIRDSIQKLSQRFINKNQKHKSKQRKKKEYNGSGDREWKELNSRDIFKKCEEERERCYQKIEANVNSLRYIDNLISQLREVEV